MSGKIMKTMSIRILRITAYCLVQMTVACVALAQTEVRFRDNVPVFVVDGKEVAAAP